MEDARFLHRQANRCYQLAWAGSQTQNRRGSFVELRRGFAGSPRVAQGLDWEAGKEAGNEK
jgi:hypothetical protein